MELWNKDEIRIPDFQRKFVWKQPQASKLIESFLIGLPVPPVFLYINNQHENLVIDGQQRIVTIALYFNGEWTNERKFSLKGLGDHSPFNNKSFDELAAEDRRKLEGRVLRALNVRQNHPVEGAPTPTSVFHIFERLNTGGTPLKPQEVRNCVFIGDLVTRLRYLNEASSWRSILGRQSLDLHERDVELILRLFALSSVYPLSYEKPMKEFLNGAMRDNQSADTPEWERFEKGFLVTCDQIIKHLGIKPFHISRPLNVSVLDSVFCAIIDSDVKIPTDFRHRYLKLVASEEFLSVIRAGTSNEEALKERMRMARELLFQ